MKIIQPSTNEEWKKYYDLRYEVLRKPWNQPYSSTKDNQEDISVHLLMLNNDGEAIAAGRLQINNKEEGQVRSMAVSDDHQGKGLGSAIVKYIEAMAREKKLKYLVLDGRENAIKFYEKLGYRIVGDAYLLFGVIQHYRMKKEL